MLFNKGIYPVGHLAGLAGIVLAFSAASAQAQNLSPAPAAAQEAWNDDRVGMFVHWGLYSGTEGEWNGSTVNGAAEWIQRGANIHSDDYEDTLRPLFNPSATWATGLAQTAKSAGMEYVVITAKHHDGFTLFNSSENWSTGDTTPGMTTNPYGGSNISPDGRDLMLELADAVRAEGMKIGFYYSLIDWQHPNAYRGNNGLPTPGAMFNGRTDENSAEPDPQAGSYKDYIYNHVDELTSNYGEISELWFDYSSSTVQDTDWDAAALMPMIRANQPNIMVNNRLYNGLENDRGDLATPERTIPADGLPFNWETAQSWDNSSWGYKTLANGANYKSVREAVMIISEAASKGGNTLLNVGPNRFGELDLNQSDRMAGLGDWMAINGESIRETRASGIDASGQWGRMTMHKSGDRYYAIVFNRPGDGQIDLTSLASQRSGRRVEFSRLTASGRVLIDGVSDDGSLATYLAASDLDSQQSAVIRIDLGAAWDNLALGKNAQASSVYTDGSTSLTPSLAVDGDLSAVSGGGLNFFHSESDDQDPWFEVDLGEDFRIGEVVLFNRNGFEQRLRDISIQIINESGQQVALYSDLNDGNTLNGPEQLVLYLDNAELVAGNRVRVIRDSTGGGDDGTVLTLSEIQVFGTYLADATLDGEVDQADLALVLSNWGQAVTDFREGDLTGEGEVGAEDLNMVLRQWTSSVAPVLSEVPEPGTAVSLFILAVLGHRRRHLM